VTENIRTLKPDKPVIILAVLIFLLGFGLRMYDVTDEPIEFHPTRQLRGAIIARGMYYEMDPNADPELRTKAIAFADSTGQYEPPLLERLVAFTYLAVGGEYNWISRIYTSIFWLIGGLAIFLLSLRVISTSTGAAENIKPAAVFASALIALAYYLVLPFAVQASRSFQPDPGMVMWIALFMYAIYRWSEEHTWGWAIAAGLFAGIGVLTKAVAAYTIAGAAISMVLFTLGWKKSWRDPQVWAMAILMILPSAIYYAGRGGRATEYFSTWTLALSHLLLDPGFYMRWFNLVQDLMGLGFLLLALVGILIAKPRIRVLMIGLWVGYLLYGLTLPYQMYTHSYYHLQVVPFVAISMIPGFEAVFAKVYEQKRGWQAAFVVIAIAGITFLGWKAILLQYSENHRNEPAYWQEISSQLPDDGKIIALTQDYGYRLMYYGWKKVQLWPTRGEKKLMGMRNSDKKLDSYFEKKTDGISYFLITSFNQFNDQPELKKYLYDHYPILAEGHGYIIFDLRGKKDS